MPSAIDYPSLPNITPEMFGAVGDGTTDDTAAIQAAANWLKDHRGGVLIFGTKDYMIRTGPVILSPGTTFQGQTAYSGVWVDGVNSAYSTRILNDSNNHTLKIGNLSISVLNIVFAGPQPVFQCGQVNADGTLGTPSARYDGYGLTDGTYALIIDGGFGSGAAGTCTVINGKVDHCTLTNAGSGYYVAGPVATPRVRAVITGGNQAGAHIYMTGGTMNNIQNCSFISKGFGIYCNYLDVVRAATGSFTAGQKVIPCTNTAGITAGMLVYNTSNPISIRKFNLIASVTPNTSFTMQANIDDDSAGAADVLVMGIQPYFVDCLIQNNSFWGTTYCAIYMGCAAESVKILNNVINNPENGAIFAGSALTMVIDGNNIDGIYHNKAGGIQCISTPGSIRNNAIGNITGPNSASFGIYVNSYLPDGSQNVSGMVIEGNMVYAPCPRGIWMEGVIGSRVGPNLCFVNGISGDATLKWDSGAYGNVFIFAGDAPGSTSLYSGGNTRNTIIGPWGIQRPFRKVTDDVQLDRYDFHVDVDCTSKSCVATLPAAATLAGNNSIGGLSFEVMKIDGGGNSLTVKSDANINLVAGATGVTTTTPFKQFNIHHAADTQWFSTV